MFNFEKSWVILTMTANGLKHPMDDGGYYAPSTIFNEDGYASEQEAWEAMKEALESKRYLGLGRCFVLPSGMLEFNPYVQETR